MNELRPFELTKDIALKIQEKGEIPINFYNQDGNIVIHKAPDLDPETLENFQKQIGNELFVDSAETYFFNLIKKDSNKDELDGLTNTKVISQRMTNTLKTNATEIFAQLQSTTFNQVHATKLKEGINSVFDDFRSQPDAMVGLINIVDMLQADNLQFDIQMAVKRTVVAMAIKTRGLYATAKRESQKIQEEVQTLMQSSMLADIGKVKMKMPQTPEITRKDLEYIRRYPLISYFLLSHEPSISAEVKRNIICQRRPLPSEKVANNYPSMQWIMSQLGKLIEVNSGNPDKAHIIKDVSSQIQLLKKELPFDESAAILSLATEFASLTSDTAWRSAMPEDTAIRTIINNSLFTYPVRVVKEFLDYTALSLNRNKKIIKPGDFLMLAVTGLNSPTYYEMVQVIEVGRFQSRPFVVRIAEVQPQIVIRRHRQFGRLKPDQLGRKSRPAQYDLTKDHSRRIVYLVDPEEDSDIFEELEARVGKVKE